MLQIIDLIKQRLVKFYYHNIINYFYIRMYHTQYLIIDVRAISYQILKLEAALPHIENYLMFTFINTFNFNTNNFNTNNLKYNIYLNRCLF